MARDDFGNIVVSMAPLSQLESVHVEKRERAVNGLRLMHSIILFFFLLFTFPILHNFPKQITENSVIKCVIKSVVNSANP